MQKLILTAIFTVALFSLSFAQTEEATTRSGKKIIINDDGTWKSAEKSLAATANTADNLVAAAEGHPVVGFEIGCKDLEKTTSFYTELFGWSPTPAPLASMLNTNSKEGIQGHITALGHEPSRYTIFYIKVKDINESLEKIEQKGGKKIIGPISLPDKRKFAWFNDPEGNMIGLITE